MKETSARRFSYVTLLGTDDYLIGTLCMAESLRNVKAQHPLLVLCSSSISSSSLKMLEKAGLDYMVLDGCIQVSGINKDGFERWNYTFDKLQVFNLIQFDKVVFLDSDMFIAKNIDHLFDSPNMSAVVADVYDQPDCTELNSGLMVIEPTTIVYKGLLDVLSSDRFKQMPMFGDQDVIRAYFSDWSSKQECRLPIGYNLFYPFMKEYCKAGGKKSDIYVVHFVYGTKPWHYSFGKLLKRTRKEGGSYLFRYALLMIKFKLCYRT